MKKIFYIAAIATALASCGGNDTQYDASGVFETTEVVVSAKAQGEIVGLEIEEGMTVKKDQPLGLIDVTQLSLRKQQLEQNRKANDDRRLDLSSQVAGIRQQIANARKEKARFEALVKDNAATQKQVDDIQYQITVLERQLAATTEQITSANTSIASTGEGIKSQISGINEQMNDATIKSPVAGTVLTKYVERGEYATPGKPLFRVANISDMKLRAYVTADQLTTLKLGQKVTVYADEGKDSRKSYEGTVTWISSEAEFTPKTIQTRDERSNLVYAVKISVKNDGNIKRGMYGDVKF